MSIFIFIEYGGIVITLFSFVNIFVLERNTKKRSKYLYLFYTSVFAFQITSFYEKLDIEFSETMVLILSTLELLIMCSGILLILPSLYLFILDKLDKVSETELKRYLFLPLLLTGLVTVLVIFGSTYSLFPPELIIIIVTLLFITFSILIGRKLFLIIKEHRKLIADQYSYTEGVDLKWVNKLSYAFFVLIGLIVITELGQLYLTQVILIQLFIAYLSLLILDYVFKNNENSAEFPLQEEKFITEIETKTQNDLFIKIESIVEEKEMFLNPSLNISDVAKEVGVNYKYVSREINQEGITFLEFINAKRVNQAKRLLEDASNQFLSVEDIGKQVGFKSKATFYKYFKEKYNQTPSMFRNSLK
jgi:AraC-like DNA-binding protein